MNSALLSQLEARRQRVLCLTAIPGSRFGPAEFGQPSLKSGCPDRRFGRLELISTNLVENIAAHPKQPASPVRGDFRQWEHLLQVGG
ncbi:MAG TPA: hypothetical protein VIS96_01150 [Terrimicrobiaceae bacterium]